MTVYNNPFHSGHVYLRIGEHEASGIRPPQFEKLLAEYRRPLQAMVSSNDRGTVDLLVKSGFILRRRCFECSFSASDLLFPPEAEAKPLTETARGSRDYPECSKLMYAYYRDTHEPVNPVTASESEFREALPASAVYTKAEGIVEAAAFIEGNEIAYVCSRALDRFSDFARSLLAYLFSRYETVSFEADDTDPAATMLRNMFSSANAASWNTYVKYP